MQYGVIITAGTPRQVAELAGEAEAAGWDGVFYWDAIQVGDGPIFDPWVVMAAMAMRTERVRIGAIMTPLARRRPWKVAREALTLDHLSGGRFVLVVGLGTLDDGGFGRVGEPTDARTRAELLDESLAILVGLWTGRPFAFRGKHYHLDEMTFLPPPVQRPRIPIWVVGAWPSERSMARATRYEGILPQRLQKPGEPMAELSLDDLRALQAWLTAHRSGRDFPFDIVAEGRSPGDDPVAASAVVRPWAEAGATWWIEADWGIGDLSVLRTRIRQGPPPAGRVRVD